MIYAGVGARLTPYGVLNKMRLIAEQKAREGWILRSGGALGADTAFYLGAKACEDSYEIFTANSIIPKWAMEIAEKHHPAWHILNSYAKKLMARNVMILCGNTSEAPKQSEIVDEMICWTPGGIITGGTGHTMRVANSFNIPIRNLYKEM